MPPNQEKRPRSSQYRSIIRFLNRPLVGNVPLFELAIVFALGLGFYYVASNLDLNERWLTWSEQYEQYELDELPLGFSIMALAFAWFAWRRWTELSKANAKLARIQESLLFEISQREKAEKIGMDIRNRLEKSILFQKKRAEQIRAIQEMGDLLIFAQDKSEILTIAVRYAKKIIPFSSGALYEFCDNNLLKHITGWGTLANSDVENSAHYKCWATRQGKTYTEVLTPSQVPLCFRATGSQQTICVPILTPKGVWGVLHFRQDSPSDELDSPVELDNIALENLSKTIADNLGLHIHSLFLREQLTLESMQDPLTGILNRRGLLKLVQEKGLLQNPLSALSVLLLDIDSFKQFNDRFGHDAGDTALVILSRLISKLIRQQDIFCRYGGEEFLLMLTHTDKSVALLRAEKIRQSVEQHVLKVGDRPLNHLTISIGVATYPWDADSYEMLVKRADEALYQAKDLGRNRVVDCAAAQ